MRSAARVVMAGQHVQVGASGWWLAVPVAWALGVGLAALGANVHPLAMLLPPLVMAGFVLAVRIPWMALLPLLATIPWGLQKVPLPGLPAATLVEIGALVSIGMGLLILLLRGESGPLPGAAGIWLLALAGVGILAAVASSDPAGTLGQLRSLLVGIGLVFTIGMVARSTREVGWMLIALVGMSALAVLPAMLSGGAITATEGATRVSGRPTGPFGHGNALGAFVAVVLPLAVSLLMLSRRWRERAGALVAVGILLAVLGLTLSRGAWLGALFGGLVILWLLPEARQLLLRLAIPVAVVFGALMIPILEDPPEPVEVIALRAGSVAVYADTATDDRPQMWQGALDLIQESPALGHGPNSYERVSATVKGNLLLHFPHPHNTLLKVGVEYGILGMLMLVGLTLSVAWEFKRASRQLGRTERWLVAGCGGALAAVVAHGLVDFAVGTPLIGLTVAYILGCGLAVVRLERPVLP